MRLLWVGGVDWSEQWELQHVFTSKTGPSLSQSGHMEHKRLATKRVPSQQRKCLIEDDINTAQI